MLGRGNLEMTMKASFTCPKCNAVNYPDPPNGEWWCDSNVEEMNCEACDAPLFIHVRVEIELIPAINDEIEGA